MLLYHRKQCIFLTLSIYIGFPDKDNVITIMTMTIMVLITGMLVRHRLLTKIGGAAAQLCIGRWYKQATSTTMSMGCFLNVPSTKMLETLKVRRIEVAHIHIT